MKPRFIVSRRPNLADPNWQIFLLAGFDSRTCALAFPELRIQFPAILKSYSDGEKRNTMIDGKHATDSQNEAFARLKVLFEDDNTKSFLQIRR